MPIPSCTMDCLPIFLDLFLFIILHIRLHGIDAEEDFRHLSPFEILKLVSYFECFLSSNSFHFGSSSQSSTQLSISYWSSNSPSTSSNTERISSKIIIGSIRFLSIINQFICPFIKECPSICVQSSQIILCYSALHTIKKDGIECFIASIWPVNQIDLWWVSQWNGMKGRQWLCKVQQEKPVLDSDETMGMNRITTDKKKGLEKGGGIEMVFDLREWNLGISTRSSASWLVLNR